MVGKQAKTLRLQQTDTYEDWWKVEDAVTSENGDQKQASLVVWMRAQLKLQSSPLSSPTQIPFSREGLDSGNLRHSHGKIKCLTAKRVRFKSMLWTVSFPHCLASSCFPQFNFQNLAAKLIIHLHAGLFTRRCHHACLRLGATLPRTPFLARFQAQSASERNVNKIWVPEWREHHYSNGQMWWVHGSLPTSSHFTAPFGWQMLWLLELPGASSFCSCCRLKPSVTISLIL